MRQSFFKGLVLLSAVSAPLAVALGDERVTQSSAAASAAESSDDGNELKEIVIVSARRREESVQEAPLTITALSDATLERNHITNIDDIQHLTPGLTMHRQVGAADVLGIYLRGFGINNNDPAVNPGVAILIDGIYQTQSNGNLVDLFDVQTIEIDKGPQGTLLGKNAPSGALSISTKRPVNTFGAEGQVKVERFGRVEGRGALNIPINDDLAVRGSLLVKQGGDYLNVYGASAFTTDPTTNTQVFNPAASHSRQMGGDDVVTGRLAALYTPSSDLTWYVSAVYNQFKSPQLIGRPIADATAASLTPTNYPFNLTIPAECSVFGYCMSLPRYAVAPDFLGKHDANNYSLTSNMDWRVGPVALTSVTGYVKYSGDNDQDIDSLPVDVLEVRGSRIHLQQFSQELRFASRDGAGLDLGGKLNWVTGVYFLDETFTYSLPLYIFGSAPVPALNQFEHEKVYSIAGFGHAEYHLTDAWSVSAGGRYTHDHKNHDSLVNPTGVTGVPTINVTHGWSNFSAEAGTSYKIDAAKMAYFRFAQGYRGGGMQGFPGTPAQAQPYNDETVNSFEIGLKSDWLNHTVRVNWAAYYNKYKDLQRTIFENSALVTQNSASATTKGVELETIIVPTTRLTLRGNANYISAHYGNYVSDAVGTGLVTDNSRFGFAYTPSWAFAVGADLVVTDNSRGKVTVSADYDWQNKQLLNILDIPLAHQSAYGVLNLNLRYEDPSRHFNVSIYGHNVLNKYYFTDVEPVSLLAPSAIEGMPVTYGIDVGFKF